MSVGTNCYYHLYYFSTIILKTPTSVTALILRNKLTNTN